MKTALLFKARKAPIGDQVNLYPNGLSQKSGDGNPPHQLSYYNIFPPSFYTSWIIFIVAKWSIPGSSPNSFKNNRFLALTCSSSYFIYGEIYEAVIRCLPRLRHTLAMCMWRNAGT